MLEGMLQEQSTAREQELQKAIVSLHDLQDQAQKLQQQIEQTKELVVLLRGALEQLRMLAREMPDSVPAESPAMGAG